MQSTPGHPRLIEQTEGVLFALGPGPHPQSIRHNGQSYFRFHDFIYVKNRIEDLNQQQVIAVCELRDRFATEQQLAPNRRVRECFRTAVLGLNPRTLLEIGPGNRPLYTSDETKFRYELLEIDHSAACNLEQLGYSVSVFNSQTPLTLESCSVDLIVAAFVFQFFVSPHQIDEITRVLHNDGLVLANVYRRSTASRRELKDLFATKKLHTAVIKHNHGIGYNHEYWVIGHHLLGPKCAFAIQALHRNQTNSTHIIATRNS